MKKNIAIIMGGYSSEVEISLKSGAVVHKNISKEVYNTYQVHILKNKYLLSEDSKWSSGKLTYNDQQNKIKIRRLLRQTNLVIFLFAFLFSVTLIRRAIFHLVTKNIELCIK